MMFPKKREEYPKSAAFFSIWYSSLASTLFCCTEATTITYSCKANRILIGIILHPEHIFPADYIVKYDIHGKMFQMKFVGINNVYILLQVHVPLYDNPFPRNVITLDFMCISNWSDTTQI
jgi:hypothetical protein